MNLKEKLEGDYYSLLSDPEVETLTSDNFVNHPKVIESDRREDEFKDEIIESMVASAPMSVPFAKALVRLLDDILGGCTADDALSDLLSALNADISGNFCQSIYNNLSCLFAQFGAELKIG